MKALVFDAKNNTYVKKVWKDIRVGEILKI